MTLVETICSLSLPNTFNPYSQTCEVADLPDAPAFRRALLEDLFAAASTTEVGALWLGRDLGYRGGRRTGLALTDEVHLSMHLRHWHLPEGQRFLKGAPVRERTASVVWAELRDVPGRVFLWNVFPFHPHSPGQPLSNRAHNSRERSIGEDLLAAVLQAVRPALVVAIGQDAARSAVRCARGRVVTVRHPSYGGLRDFQHGIRSIYSRRRSDG